MKFARILAFILAFIMMLSFVACKDNAADGNNADNGDIPGDTSDDTSGDTPKDDDENKDPTDEVVYTPIDEYLKAMASSNYRVNANVKENIGLTDPSVVGVDEYKYRNEELYPVPADSEFGDRIYRAADYDIVPHAPDNSAKINQLLKDIKDVEGLKMICFKPEVYLLEDTIKLDGQKDLYICCEDRTKNFEFRLKNWSKGFTLSNCENVHFNNFDFDYVDSPTVAGEIIRVDASKKQVVLKIFEEFDLTRPLYLDGKGNPKNIRTYIEFELDENGEWIPYNIAGSGTLVSYNAETREMVLEGVNSDAAPSSSVEKTKVGTRASIAYTVYNNDAFNGGSNKSVYFENINIYAAAGMAFVFGGSNVYMNRVDIDLREGSNRLMTATADGLHCNGCPVVKVTNSTSMYTHDDSFNIKGAYYEVTGWAGKSISLKAAASGAFEVGDQIDIYDGDRFDYIGRFTIVEIEAGGKLQLNEAPEGLSTSCLVANDTKAPTFHLENSVMGNKRNRAILVQCRRSVIKGNVFKNYYHGTICIHTVRDGFNEGICPTDIEIVNNKFISGTCGVSAGAFGNLGFASPGIFSNISVKNNFFYGTNPGISMGYLLDSEIRNNLFYNVGLDKSSESARCAINIGKSINVEITDNYSYHDQYDDNYKVVCGRKGDGVAVNMRNKYVPLAGKDQE